MQNYSSNKMTMRNFYILLVILFLMEFARGMYVLSYLPLLPTATSIAVSITSIAISIHFISDSISNFFVGFVLKRLGPTIVLTLGFILALVSLFLVIFMPTSPVVLILSSIMLGIAVCPIWVIMLASVDERTRGKQMGYVYFSWLSGMLAGMITMNLIFKSHPTHFNFLMSLCVAIAFVLYWFVKVKLTDYNTKNVKQQLRQIVSVSKRHLILFPGILLQGLAISALVPVLPQYALDIVGVTTLEYTLAIVIGGVGCTISMLFLSKIIDAHSTRFMYFVIFLGFVIYGTSIFILTFLTHIVVVWIIAFFIGVLYGILLPAWNTFMASFIHPSEQEETWGVINSIQGFGAMIGPLFGGPLSQFFGSPIYTFYFAALIIFFLAIFYGSYFVKRHQS
ncbi:MULTISPECIES: lipoteichoic acid biosynthesis MFS flippase LtaA [Staphylococcus]|uniref:MFS transporter n=1 Tax=Staphylococcus coagulans TaxID=74706 RepID=A0A9X1JA15_9STAP|nr:MULTISPECIES: MFS transporter [Staphylococcus]NHA35494.1 MFS transporter [Staphylococcus schleiferi]MBA8772256.1 MFS transporter [Staphylococcus coagulans]MBA8777313.1 MFS transporter [Staphylococcus coagulans]MBT2829987.1 MFS transporter [Staphylococcus coagulans]MBT2860472.1 MFS transporter [Staphylococcus coagulans]